jgi:hypothetical protein
MDTPVSWGQIIDFEFVAGQTTESLLLEIETYAGAFPFSDAVDLLANLEDCKNHASRHLTYLKRNLGLNDRELHLTTEDMWSFGENSTCNYLHGMQQLQRLP